MRFRTALFALWLVFVSIPAYSVDGHRLDREATLFVEPGDSYIKLFGSGWLSVFQANSSMSFYDEQGNLVHSPDKLVIGTKLVLPAGTNLTEFAMQRLSRYEDMRGAAMKCIRQAESFLSARHQNESEVYRQGLDLLARAKEVAKGLTYGFGNYVEARRLSEEAIRCFKVDMDLHEASEEMKILKNRVEEERIHADKEIGILSRQRTVFLGLATVLSLGLFLFMRTRKKRERMVKVRGWLEGHVRRAEGLERVNL